MQEKAFKIQFRVGGFGIYNTSTITFFPNRTAARFIDWQEYDRVMPKDTFVIYDEAEAKDVYAAFLALKTDKWPSTFEVEGDLMILDGTQWSMTITEPDGNTRTHSGSNAYPRKWRAVTTLFGIS
ncbi:hypothetical protein EVJ27_06150 [Exiguobacterium sp. SH3S2]|uniref:hypothetical protein n=1 Tax=unclassified Exiguobacterium TaxID=2644629 RepID=UPI00103DB844|nr:MULTISPECIES: hypothetical protein [unclassified Exiguobacterium]TCI46071.1 hypothetical protein EVJ28_06145 [Exiguobacterium sp. SH3S3]TCI61159.1 hypothetical protein EVJ27_06150 [Exiguobacterium sp. SH3S2]